MFNKKNYELTSLFYVGVAFMSISVGLQAVVNSSSAWIETIPEVYGSLVWP